jgi:geranylgeranyl reductase family protein
MRSKKVIIIGAGPNSCYAGEILAKKGHDVTIFEQKSNIGKPMQCTGIVTNRFLDIIKVPKSLIINRVKKVVVQTKNKRTCIPSDDIVIDRIGFDLFMAESAKSSGVKINIASKVTDIEHGKLKIKQKTTGLTIDESFDVLIGGDGPDSMLHRYINDRDLGHYIGLQARVSGNFDKESYSVFLGDLCPDFFCWIVPESSNIARIGLASKNNPNKLFDKFKNQVKFDKVIEKQGGKIPIYDPKTKIQKNNLYLIGDAAGQVKATTGGGLVPGLTCAKLLAESIHKNDNYPDSVKKIMRNLKISLLVRNRLNRFKEKEYEKLIDLIDDKKIKRILSDTTRDDPLKLGINVLIKKPELIIFLLARGVL